MPALAIALPTPLHAKPPAPSGTGLYARTHSPATPVHMHLLLFCQGEVSLESSGRSTICPPGNAYQHNLGTVTLMHAAGSAIAL